MWFDKPDIVSVLFNTYIEQMIGSTMLFYTINECNDEGNFSLIIIHFQVVYILGAWYYMLI